MVSRLRRTVNLLDTVILMARNQRKSWFQLGSDDLAYMSKWHDIPKEYLSPIHGFTNLLEDQDVESLFKFVAFPAAYAGMAYTLGVQGSLAAHLYIISSEFARGMPTAASSAVLTTSAVIQREVWQNIGDERTGAVHFAGAGGMSGGTMPLVPYSSDMSFAPSVNDWMGNVYRTLTVGL
jgi:hypothetical protein